MDGSTFFFSARMFPVSISQDSISGPSVYAPGQQLSCKIINQLIAIGNLIDTFCPPRTSREGVDLKYQITMKYWSIMQISKKSPLPWWERDREMGKVAEISHVTPFHPPIKGGGVFFDTFARVSLYKNTGLTNAVNSTI
ncbi:MAG: hypothetical protein PHG20_11275 [Geobacteraceae bacterium]|nr:hypothetical protein [Geobacteraceae bacterium]